MINSPINKKGKNTRAQKYMYTYDFQQSLGSLASDYVVF